MRLSLAAMTGCLLLAGSAALAGALPRPQQATPGQQTAPAPAPPETAPVPPAPAQTAAPQSAGPPVPSPAEPAPAQPAPRPADASPPQTGPELFVSAGCQHCHAIDSVGGHKGPDLSGIGRTWKNDAIKQRIEQGTLLMPAYADVLGPGDIDKLVAYLHTRRSRPRKAAKPAHAPPPAQAAQPDPA